jgi:hypothetical protein
VSISLNNNTQIETAVSLFSDSVTLTGKQKCHLDYIQGFGKISAPPPEKGEKNLFEKQDFSSFS